MLATEFINFKHEQNSKYLEIWFHYTELDSDYTKSSTFSFAEDELENPIIAWCVAHAPDFPGGNQEELDAFVIERLGNEIPLPVSLNILRLFQSLLPSSHNQLHFYPCEVEFFHYGSPVVIDFIHKERLLNELKAFAN